GNAEPVHRFQAQCLQDQHIQCSLNYVRIRAVHRSNHSINNLSLWLSRADSHIYSTTVCSILVKSHCRKLNGAAAFSSDHFEDDRPRSSKPAWSGCVYKYERHTIRVAKVHLLSYTRTRSSNCPTARLLSINAFRWSMAPARSQCEKAIRPNGPLRNASRGAGLPFKPKKNPGCGLMKAWPKRFSTIPAMSRFASKPEA